MPDFLARWILRPFPTADSALGRRCLAWRTHLQAGLVISPGNRRSHHRRLDSPPGFAFIRDARRRGTLLSEMILSCQDLCCQRTNWNECDEVSIRDVTLSFFSGTFYEFSGPDHSSRDLLMNNLALLEPWDSGTIWLDGRNLHQILESDLRRLRNETFGFVLSIPVSYVLLRSGKWPMPLFRICGADANAARERTHDVLDFCGIRNFKSSPAAWPVCSAAGCLGACLGSWSANPGRHLPVCPSDLHDLAWRAADELGVCVLWAGQDGSASGKAQKKDSGARRLRLM